MKKTKKTNPLTARRGYVVATGLVVFALAATAVSVRSLPSASVREATIAKKAPIIKIPTAPSKSEIEKQLDAIQVIIPTFDLSASPIPNITLSSLNLLLPQLPSTGLLQNFSSNSDFGFSGDITIPIPDVNVTISSGSSGSNMPTGIPTGIPAGIPTGIPATPTPSVPSAPPSSPSAPPALNADICAQFASVPSCSYLEGSNRTMCEQCETAGL